MKSQFLTHLDKRDLDDKNFCLLKPLVYTSKILGGTITVPLGFVSDGSSTPRVPFVYWLYGDRAHHEAVIHDYLYRVIDHVVDIEKNGIVKKVKVTRQMADDVFFEAMQVRKKSVFVRYGMWVGVRLGGWNSYKSGPKRYKIKKI